MRSRSSKHARRITQTRPLAQAMPSLRRTRARATRVAQIAIAVHCAGSPSPSKTLSMCRAWSRDATRRSMPRIAPVATQRSLLAHERPAPSCSAKRPPRNSRRAATCRPRATRIPRITRRGDPRVARRRRSPLAWCRLRSARKQPGQLSGRRPIAELWALNPPLAGCHWTGLRPLPRRSTPSACTRVP